MEAAINKIRAEITANANNGYVNVIGEFLLQHLTVNPQSAEKILAEDKTIIKSLEAMRKEAEKKKVGNCAVLTDAEGFTVVLEYFGFEGAAVTAPKESTLTKPSMAPVSHESDFDVKLDDFL